MAKLDLTANSVQIEKPDLVSENELIQTRLDKLHRLREQGVDPYPPRVARTHTAAQAIAAFENAVDATEPIPVTAEPVTVQLAGRIISWRIMGKSLFAHISDSTGKIQLYFKRDDLGEEAYEHLKRDFDIGDFIQVAGYMFRTKTGEITCHVTAYGLISKSLHPLPEKWHGLKDVETRYRQRYLDLIANEEIREIFITRSRIVTAMRRFLDDRGFLEVETPVLQPLYGGASARPFETFHQALNRKLFLRISDELYLKRLIVGGLDKVYEIGRDFRNEGIDTKHNPEFTMMECYQAYADYADMMELTESMVAFIGTQVLGTTKITYQGQEIDLMPPWPRYTMRDIILHHSGVDIAVSTTLESLRAAIRDLNLKDADPGPTWGKQVDEIFKAYVEPHLSGPAFVMDYPVELSPLAKRKPGAPHLVERFEAFIGGFEIANAFSELNDPLDQRERFLDQGQQQAAGDEDAQPLDEDYIQALMVGMPPTGGLGIGIDRFAMVLTDQASIREVILFPQLRA
ncbi:MAG: lysine--tRNA ligase [Chloroflexi bacterium]|nr:lysine--tRNA ligase [Chloroflexota bacterium]